MSEKEDRLPAYPKRTIREKQGSHGDLSNCRLDYIRIERAIHASQETRKNMLIKDRLDAWNYRRCKPQDECSAVIEIRRHRLPTCRKAKECSWAIYQGIDALI
jgi:hypothetical protein